MYYYYLVIKDEKNPADRDHIDAAIKGFANHHYSDKSLHSINVKNESSALISFVKDFQNSKPTFRNTTFKLLIMKAHDYIKVVFTDKPPIEPNKREDSGQQELFPDFNSRARHLRAIGT